MIDQHTISRILDSAEIVEVVSDFINLRRRGVNYLGLCPFHNEKTPSFTVSPAKGIYKCFGCGKAGNAVNFIMEHETLTYPEALKWLAKKYNIEVVEKEETDEEKQQKDDRESMMIVSSFAQKFFSRYLWEENEGRVIGLSYFRERGLHDTTINKFELGYAPDGKSIFTEAAQRQGYQMEFLEKTGLTIKRDDWVRDRFAGRVMFPVHSLAGRVIAFGGRVLKTAPDTAKYLNSPESEIYHKSNVLYGIFQAKREMTRLDKCYLVEGYTDVLSMSQAGIENVVASSGTALTVEQIRLIKRFTPNVTIIYDGDEAGIKASLRGIDLVLEEGMNVKVLLLPDGEDPDSFACSHSASELTQFIEANETDFIRFKTRLLLKNTENDPIGRAKLITDIIRSVSVIPDAITRTVYLKECSKLMNVEESVLYSEVRKLQRKKAEGSTPSPVFERPQKRQQDLPIISYDENHLQLEEKEVLRFLFKYCHAPLFETEDEHGRPRVLTGGEFIITEIEKEGLATENTLFSKIMEEVKTNLSDPGFEPFKYFIAHRDENITRLTSDLFTEKHVESKLWQRTGAYTKEEEMLDILIPKSVNEYKLRIVIDLLLELEKEIDTASKSNDFDKIFEKQSTYVDLKKVEKILSDRLNNRTFI
jgi:DNA primase